MDIALWIIQSVAAIFFLMAGSMKLFQPFDRLAVRYPWMKQTPQPFVRFIGACELAGGLGLILPAVTRIVPQLTIAAAAGLAALMACAIVFHLQRREISHSAVTLVICLIALFIALGRWTLAPL
jgi:putative oxidoreductase